MRSLPRRGESLVNNSPKDPRRFWILAFCATVLVLAASWRGAEYDEQYTLFLTGGVARPDWPATAFPAGLARALQAGHAGPMAIARDLRITDVHPPLYFWLVSAWRTVFGPSLFAARLLSVALGLGALWLVGMIATRVQVPPMRAMLMTLGCYAFAYTSVIARGFALAQVLVLGSVLCALIGERAWRFLLAGVLLGAATFSNYLAVFTAGAVVVAVGLEVVKPRRLGGWSSHPVIVVRCISGLFAGISVDRLTLSWPASCRQSTSLLAAPKTWMSGARPRLSGSCLEPPPHPASPPPLGAERGVDAAPRVPSPPLGAERPGEVGRGTIMPIPGRTKEIQLPRSIGRRRHPIEPDTRGTSPAITTNEERQRLPRPWTEPGHEESGGTPPRRSPNPIDLLTLLFGFLLFIPADLWWFLAQRGSRPGQFPPFALATGLARLAVRFSGAVLGGLPLYADGIGSTILSALLAVLLLSLVSSIVWRWRDVATPPARRLFALAALASPIGLPFLGFVFNNTPIEVRYLTFSTPFIALLLAGALPARGAALLLTVQAVAIVGLMIAPRTMQPASAAAHAATALVGDGVVLLPRGNDGVGVVGAFAIEAAPTLPLLLVDAADTPERIRARIRPWHRVVLALLEQDAASRAACDTMRATLSGWREVAREANVAVYDRTGN
jgi:hypothetical protein